MDKAIGAPVSFTARRWGWLAKQFHGQTRRLSMICPPSHRGNSPSIMDWVRIIKFFWTTREPWVLFFYFSQFFWHGKELLEANHPHFWYLFILVGWFTAMTFFNPLFAIISAIGNDDFSEWKKSVLTIQVNEKNQNGNLYLGLSEWAKQWSGLFPFVHLAINMS